MANPVNFRSLSEAAEVGAGTHQRTRGHHYHSLFVAAENDPGGSLEVALEGSPDAERWSVMETLEGDDFTEDLDDDGNTTGWTAMVHVEGAYVEFLRATIRQMDGVAVDAFVMSGGNAGSGTRGQPEHQPDSANP